MDYMNLGVRSRKTGLQIKRKISRDSFNLEKIDDFFKEDDSTPTSTTTSRKSFNSSTQSTTNLASPSPLLANLNRNTGNNTLQSPSKLDWNSSSDLTNNNPNSRVSNILLDNYTNYIDDDTNNNYQDGSSNDSLPEKTPSNTFKDSKSEVMSITAFRKAYDLISNRVSDVSSVPNIQNISPILDTISEDVEPIISEKNYTNPYMEDIPELSDENDTIENTPLNTSENALLEEEIDKFDMEEIDSENENGSEVMAKNRKEKPTAYEIIDSDDSDFNPELDRTYIPSSDIEELTRTQINHTSNSIDTTANLFNSSAERFNNTENSSFDNSADEKFLRRSKRVKVPPLEYWRNEKIVYKRKSTEPVLDITKIITFDNEDSETERKQKKLKRIKRFSLSNNQPTNDDNNDKNNDNTTATPAAITITNSGIGSNNFQNKRKRPVGRPRKHPLPPDKNIENFDIASQSENGTWLTDGILTGEIHTSQNDINNDIIAYGPNTYQLEKTKENRNEKYSLAVTFDKHKDLFASGMLKLPVKGNRNLTHSQNAFITFYVVQGSIEVTLGNNKFITVAGCTFQIPSFNKYSFINRGPIEAQLFFVQVLVPDNFASQIPSQLNAPNDASDFDSDFLSNDDNSETRSDSESDSSVDLSSLR